MIINFLFEPSLIDILRFTVCMRTMANEIQGRMYSIFLFEPRLIDILRLNFILSGFKTVLAIDRLAFNRLAFGRSGF